MIHGGGPRRYRPELDGLRGVAIIMVMAFHAEVPWAMGGFIGVDIFFVLSGFLITSLIVAEFDASGSVGLKNFYMRRALRLLPALLGLIIVLCLLSLLLLPPDLSARNLVDSLIALFYLTNWARAFSMHAPTLLGHTWSLSIEEQFYIIWPVTLLMMLRHVRSRWLIVHIILVIAAASWGIRLYLHWNGASLERLYNGLDTRADALMIGCAIGVAYASGCMERTARIRLGPRILSVLAATSAVGLCWIFVVASWRAPVMYEFGFTAIAGLAAVVIIDAVVGDTGVMRRILVTKLLVWIGSISYGLYLWHYPVYRMLFWLKFDGLSVACIGTIGSFGLAILSYKIIEAPFLKLKRKFELSPVEVRRHGEENIGSLDKQTS